ncbi:hypothetical protein Bca4012_050367 [Brassica carinata]|uniref:RING-type E3 ubiquitin transferase n=1 Tax=Brassica carinata TaxID=52824 RepID=A0A8X7R3H6_BRACI|nr:hypothetical protein Bca52824_053074 [Brassica carinata]
MYEYSFNKLNQVISHISCIFFKIIFLVYIFYDRDCNNMIRIYVKRLKLSQYVTKHRNVDIMILLEVEIYELRCLLHISVSRPCCVCLGEFELKEELVEMPSCKHIFHLDCIHIWLYSHTTCPLCRSSVFISSTKTSVDDNDHPNSSQTSPV